jgi:hypothetical protein
MKNFQRLFSYGVASLELTNGSVTSAGNFASEMLELGPYLSSLLSPSDRQVKDPS